MKMYLIGLVILFKEINPKITNGEEMEFSLLLGDFAYWDADISNIVDEVYSPVQDI